MYGVDTGVMGDVWRVVSECSCRGHVVESSGSSGGSKLELLGTELQDSRGLKVGESVEMVAW